MARGRGNKIVPHDSQIIINGAGISPDSYSYQMWLIPFCGQGFQWSGPFYRLGTLLVGQLVVLLDFGTIGRLARKI